MKRFFNKVENVRQRLIEKGEQTIATRISFSGFALNIEIIPMAHNLSTKFLKTETCMVSITNSTERLIKRYTEDFIVVDFDEITEKRGFNVKALGLFSNQIIAFGSGLNRKYLIDMGDYYIDLRKVANGCNLIPPQKNTSFSCKVNKCSIKIPANASYYSGNGICAGSSPSQKRKKTIVFYKNNDIKHYKEIMDAVTYGAYSLIKDTEITRAKATKIDARLNQYLAPSSFTEYHIPVAAFYMAKWEDDEGNSHKDGQAYTSATFVKEMFNNKLNYEYFINQRDVTGTLLQCRP